MKVHLPSIPPPTTFAEGQRALFGCLVAGAGMFCGAVALAMIALLMWGGWSAREEHTIVVIFGWTLGGFVAAMTIVIIGLLVGGPVGRFKGGVGKTGLEWEAEGTGPTTPQAVAADAAAKGAAAVAAAVADAKPVPPTAPEPETPRP